MKVIIPALQDFIFEMNNEFFHNDFEYHQYNDDENVSFKKKQKNSYYRSDNNIYRNEELMIARLILEDKRYEELVFTIIGQLIKIHH